MTLRKRSLSTIVAATLVTVTTLVLGTYSYIVYLTQARRETEQLRRLSALQLREVCVALSLPLWNIDREGIERVLEAMAQPKSIYGIRVVAAGKTYGRVRNARWELVPWNGAALPPDLWVYDAPILFSRNHVGDVRLLVTPRFLRDDLLALRLRLVTAVLIVDLLLVASVYFVLARMVLAPVRAIEHYAGEVSAGQRQARPAVPPRTRELANLLDSFQSMVELLEARFVALQQEMALRSETEERFRSVFESVNDAIILRDPETGRILDANRAATEISGYTREELCMFDAGGLSSGVPPYDRAGALERFHAVMSGTTSIYEWHAQHRDGHLFWVEASMRLAEIAGEPVLITVNRDITQRRAMEAALRLSERMSAIGEIAAGVAHEVRNPLFGISATLDAFNAEFGPSDETAEYMAILYADLARLTTLMNDLLDYGRPQQLDRHVQSVEPVIAEAMRVCAARATERQIEIRPRLEAPLPPAEIDADRMLQAFKNVVENAIEFSSAGGTVFFDARAERNGAQTLVFSVADQGPGFRDEDLPHVFEPFFTRRRGGSGLGLAIVQKIVSDHGGEIAAQNAAGGGARVEIRLPATDARPS